MAAKPKPRKPQTPAVANARDTTIERLILEILAEGEREYEKLADVLTRIYETTGDTYRLLDFENSLSSLLRRKLITSRGGHWESEFFYRLTKKAAAQKFAPGQRTMF